MIRNETFIPDGTCIYAEIIDLENDLYAIEENGVRTLERTVTLEERQRYGPQPLDSIGAMAALNVVLGIWDINDAANIAKVTPEALITEVEGWAAASTLT